MYKFTTIILFIVMFLLSGCASITANNYLKEKEIEKGINFTTKELDVNPNDSVLNYYHGRFLISQKKYKESQKYLKKAIEGDYNNSKYMFWLANAYGKNKQYSKEREQYIKILNETDNYHKKALIYLGRNLYKTQEYENSIIVFEQALNKYKKHHPYTLYYYSQSLRKTNQLKTAQEYYHKFLLYYPEHSLANKAVKRLNNLGDFSYSNVKIFNKTIPIKNITYLKDSDEFEYYSKESLKKISQLLSANKKESLVIITYEKDKPKKAERRAAILKDYLLSLNPEINPSQILTKWKKRERIIKRDKKTYKLNSYVHFYTKNEK